MCINRLGSIVLKLFWNIVDFLVFGEVKSSLVVKNALNNNINKDYSISLDKNGQQKFIKVANVWTIMTIKCSNQTLMIKNIWQH